MGNHRADTRGLRAAAAETPAAPAGGRRKATRADRVRRSPRRPSSITGPTGFMSRIPAAPTLVGATALLVAGAGAIGLSSGQLPGRTHLQLSAGASALGGTDAFAFSRDDSRARAISRDSERQALQDAANQQLKNEAEKQNQQRSAALTSLAKDAEKRASQIAENQWHLPTLNYHLTGRFGMVSGLWATFHTGLDFATATGTPIFAVANGVITSTGWDGPYGNKTVETLDDGTEIWYAHQSEIDVQPGQKVTGGQTIGKVGSTGNTTGPHVHIEVRPGGGDPVDPYPAFIQHGVTP
ncbi:M23 family metallopeptidase [Nocardioides terrisoli]|uniref:M23 family metallopeptidase n=1 Tax=Nocardioides terrisoli TaxID=3388267 RepID=UPI00287B77C0|nr:M23 family metallopeptidase [Nocardioides marmorisolisilvae]